jgi:hypothetical protein
MNKTRKKSAPRVTGEKSNLARSENSWISRETGTEDAGLNPGKVFNMQERHLPGKQYFSTACFVHGHTLYLFYFNKKACFLACF